MTQPQDRPAQANGDHLALMRQAVAIGLNRTVEINLHDGRRFIGTFTILGFDSVVLADGGFLPLADIRSFHPVLMELEPTLTHAPTIASSTAPTDTPIREIPPAALVVTPPPTAVPLKSIPRRMSDAEDETR